MIPAWRPTPSWWRTRWQANISFIDNGSNPVALSVGGNNATTVFSGSMSGPGSLTKAGSGTLTLTAANTFSGNTLINGGTVVIGNSLALQNSTFDTGGAGTLSFGSQTAVTLGGLTNSGPVVLPNGLTLSVGNNNSTYSGNMSGSGNLIKIGTGQLALSGVNSYRAPRPLAPGQLQFQGASALPSGAVLSVGLVSGSTSVLSIRQ